MNHPVDVHPEDLLDYELTRELSADERARLDAHTARCAPCAIVRAAKRDFEAERRSAPGDAHLVARMSAVALGAAPSLVGNQVGPRSAFVLSRPRRRRRAWAAAAVVLFAATGATASFWSVRPAMFARLFAHAPGRAAATSIERHDRTEVAAKPTSAPRAENVAPIEPTLPALPAPQPRVAQAPAARARVVDEAPPPATAEQVFAAANEARRRGDSVQAARLYRQLQQQFPGTRQEISSRYLLGRLLQDRGEDPAQSLALFTRYLAESPNGTLAEEARMGRALALMRLGRTQDERQAWQELLSSTDPKSSYAERARKRLDELR
jgi:TolA-binding protein